PICSTATGRKRPRSRRSPSAPSRATPARAEKTCTKVLAGPKYPGFDTLALHAGQSPDPATGSRAVPIYQTAAYVFRDTEHAASLFNMERAGNVYSRIGNPTVAVLEERIAALEGGVGAVCTASGQAALHLAIATLMGQGGHIVAATSLYGGAINVLTLTLPRFGIPARFVEPRDPVPDRAVCRVSRHRFRRGVRSPGLHHAGARRRPARFRRLHEPDQRLPHPAGGRDAARPHGAPCREHACGAGVSREERGGFLGQ